MEKVADVHSYAGKIARVNLTTRKISTELTSEYAKRFIGGRGINQWILFNEMSPGVRWFDPENLLAFGMGPLLGTLAPGACRVSVDTKNAFSGGTGSSNSGGHFGPEVKFAGFDHVVIQGRAEKPAYLWIYDGAIEILDASATWGKDTWQTEEIIRRDLGDRNVKVACIGPAGENLVKASSIISDRSFAAGGSGVGAVMGSKKLKALAARGSKSITVAEPKKFEQAVKAALAKVNLGEHKGGGKMAPMFRADGLYLTHMAPDNAAFWDTLGLAVRNAQDEYIPMEKREKVTGMAMKKYKKGMTGCFNCPLGCFPVYNVNGITGEGFWVNSMWAWMARFDALDPGGGIRNHFLTNQLGLDGDNASVVISWAFECYQRGLLTKNETDGLELEWGDHEAITKMIEKLAHRSGIGNFLADGVKAASERLGRGSDAFAIHIKGQDSLDTIRIQKGWGVGIVVSPVAGRHLRGAWFGGPGGSSHVPPDLDPVSFESPCVEYVVRQEQHKAILDMLGVCNYVGGWECGIIPPEDMAILVSSATGMEITADRLMQIGAQIHNVEKAFNTLHAGFSRKDDFPPSRFMNEPVKSGPFKGQRIEKDRWEMVLDEYYQLHGWDKKTGWQTRESLEKLGLREVAEKLSSANKLIEA